MTKPTTPLEVIEDEATGNRFLAYTTKDGAALDVMFDGENPWFTQADMASMFGVTVQAVSQHIQLFIDDGELDTSTLKDFLIVRQEGSRQVKRQITHYGLDVAFYVGYRVNSVEGRLFRKWATQALVQLAMYGFVVDKRRLKGSPDRLRQLREIIADIRSDEANMYAELRDICAMCQDYDPSAPASRDFFAHFQNRMLYAVTEHTAAEIIRSRADATAENMGLTVWDGDRVLQSHTSVAKNYLGELELRDLNRLVGMVLDYFEDQTERGWLVSMEDAEARLLEILTVNRRHMLQGFGRVSASAAKKHAHAENKKFSEARKVAAVEELKQLAAEKKSAPRSRSKKSKK